jgi:hypothetical protein
MRIIFFISSRVFVALVVAAVAAPLHATSVTNKSMESRLSVEPDFNIAEALENSEDEAITIPIWIPGFDDVDPELACSFVPTSKVTSKVLLKKSAGMDACRGIMRMMPWISQPVPIKHMQYLLPMI